MILVTLIRNMIGGVHGLGAHGLGAHGSRATDLGAEEPLIDWGPWIVLPLVRLIVRPPVPPSVRPAVHPFARPAARPPVRPTVLPFVPLIVRPAKSRQNQ